MNANTYPLIIGGDIAPDGQHRFRAHSAVADLRIYSATLSAGDVQSAMVIAEDTIPPEIDPVSSHTLLWPPNHNMVEVAIQANVTDDCDASPELTVVVTSNEADDGTGDGYTVVDHEVLAIDQSSGSILVSLRAERSGAGSGREYYISITATDASGNATTEVVVVSVPHDYGKKK